MDFLKVRLDDGVPKRLWWKFGQLLVDASIPLEIWPCEIWFPWQTWPDGWEWNVKVSRDGIVAGEIHEEVNEVRGGRSYVGNPGIIKLQCRAL